ncbi:MAG: KDGP aldolase, partial [Providencia rustigianii]
STGPLSSQAPDGIVPIETAIMMLKDMGADSVKFFNMQGLKHIEEYTAIAKACAKFDFSLEPTGGIDLDNFTEILQIALDAGVKKIIPHIYSSIIDSATGDTRPEDVRQLLEMVKQAVN